MSGTRQFAIIRLAIVAVLTATLVLISFTPSQASEDSSAPVAVGDSYELYGFMGKQNLLALANDIVSEDGGSLTYHSVSKTDSQYGDTTVKITDKGQMQVSIAAFDSGDTITWTYRVQDEMGRVSEPATVQLHVMDFDQMRARRTDRGRRATFKNRNDFAVQIRLDWSSEYSGKKEDKLFIVPANAEKSVRMRKPNVRYIATALPWKKKFFIAYI